MRLRVMLGARRAIAVTAVDARSSEFGVRSVPSAEGNIQPTSAFTVSVCNLRPTSRGHVRLKSPDPLAAPEIRLNYLSTPEDQRIAVQSLRLTRRIIAGSETMKKYAPDEFVPGPAFQSDDELVHAAGNVGTTIFHPVGTCRMGGADDELAVVDTRLRVRGVARLRVIDASIMPTITSGNTASPTVMIAEKGATAVIEDRQAGARPPA
jgi:choline dehydrogenase